jgi:hypothetical protein
MTRYKYTTARQVGGDDGYCWAVFVKGDPRPRVEGLTKPEVPSYRQQFEREAERAVADRKERAEEIDDLQMEIDVLESCRDDPSEHAEDVASYRHELSIAKEKLAELKIAALAASGRRGGAV